MDTISPPVSGILPAEGWATALLPTSLVNPAAPAPALGPAAGAWATRPGAGSEATKSEQAAAAAAALEAALRLRSPQAHAPTPLVRRLAVQMCRHLGVDEAGQELVDRAARTRDVGMIGLPDGLIMSSGPLGPGEWEAMTRHPVLSAELVTAIPGLEDAAAIVRSHHERWDGAGYPDGLVGDDIPLLSRVISVADALVAIASDRPHRRAAGIDVALEHIAGERGAQFDPSAVDALFAVLNRYRPPGVARPRPQEPAKAPRRASGGSPGSGLGSALVAFDQLPAFAPARERALAAASATTASARGDLVAAIESDTGLTVAILREAQQRGKGKALVNIPDALAALDAERVQHIIATVPAAAFPWETAQEALLYELRVHGQSVARAVDRIARESGVGSERDALITAALLHDVGKLVLAGVEGAPLAGIDEREAGPEQRVREERRALQVDHPSAGGLLMQRWELPQLLCDVVASHHRAEGEDELGTPLRLADMIARQAHRDVVDRRIMLQLASACGLSSATLRDVLFDLPHSGSQRRRAQPSPLSKRETAALRGLAAGKVYNQIAEELGISASTVRSHLHQVYAKLKVEDRAQAVLMATEMGWL